MCDQTGRVRTKRQRLQQQQAGVINIKLRLGSHSEVVGYRWMSSSIEIAYVARPGRRATAPVVDVTDAQASHRIQGNERWSRIHWDYLSLGRV